MRQSHPMKTIQDIILAYTTAAPHPVRTQVKCERIINAASDHPRELESGRENSRMS